LIIVVTENIFPPQAVSIVPYVTAFLSPNAFPTYRNLQALPKKTRIFCHINDHKLKTSTAISAEGKMIFLSLNFEVKPLSI
jgi:hypothetical protein